MEHAMLWINGVIILNGIIILAVVTIVLREVRLIGQSMERIAETSSRSERISAKVLTMLAGIEAEDQ